MDLERRVFIHRDDNWADHHVFLRRLHGKLVTGVSSRATRTIAVVGGLGLVALAILLTQFSDRFRSEGAELLSQSRASNQQEVIDEVTLDPSQEGAEARAPAERQPTEALDRAGSENPLIAAIESRFPIKGRTFGQIEEELDRMSLVDLDEIIAEIGAHQMQEMKAFMDSWGLDSLRMTTEEEYHLQKVWQFEDLLALSVRRDGRLSGEYVVIEENDSPALFGLREMVRTIRRVDKFNKRDMEAYAEFIAKAQESCPQSVLVEGADRGVAYFVNPDGSICAGRRVGGL